MLGESDEGGGSPARLATKGKQMTTITISVSDQLFVRNVGGEKVNLDTTTLSAAVAASIFEVGAKTVLTNAWNGGGKDATDAERKAALERKMAAWYRGEFAVATRGDSQMTAMREQYVDERKAAAGMTTAQVERSIKDTVKQVFGADTAATFDNFLNAVATLLSKRDGETRAVADIREEVESGLAKRTEEAAAKRAKVASKLDLSAVDLGF
jgi:septal ring factor EnvC (AmiA/AmiB activator)